MIHTVMKPARRLASGQNLDIIKVAGGSAGATGGKHPSSYPLLKLKRENICYNVDSEC